ncbi:olfactory receptor 7E178-like [Thomomys bottae]
MFHGSRNLVMASVMYMVVSPMLNPFIYSLRKRDISGTLRRLGSSILGTEDLALAGSEVSVSSYQPVLRTEAEPLLGNRITVRCLDLYTSVMAKERNGFTLCLSNIEAENFTLLSEFQLMSLSENPDLQPILFGLFLSLYLITVLGNLLIILAVISDPNLHTPMYLFLSILSLADIGFTSSTVPKMLVDLQTHRSSISYVGCLTQMSVYILCGSMDNMLLTVMAYDRFVAICQPLQYPVIMNPHLCGFLVLVSFLASILDSQMHNLFVLHFPNFKDVEVSNFFCDPSDILRLLSCDKLSCNTLKYVSGVLFGFIPISGILFSYSRIVSSVLRLSSLGGRRKAFSTCGSHLSVVCLFYGTSMGMYLGSAVSESPGKGLGASVMYTVVIPMLNPFIYSLRNKEIQSTLRRLHSKAM